MRKVYLTTITIFLLGLPVSLGAQIDTEKYMQEAAELRDLYAEQGNELLWYLESKLETGSAGEKWGVIQIFQEEHVFELFPSIIDLLSDTSEIGIYSDISYGLVAQAAAFSLYTVSRDLGAKPDDLVSNWVYDNLTPDRLMNASRRENRRQKILAIKTNWENWYKDHKWLFPENRGPDT